MSSSPTTTSDKAKEERHNSDDDTELTVEYHQILSNEVCPVRFGTQELSYYT